MESHGVRAASRNMYAIGNLTAYTATDAALAFTQVAQSSGASKVFTLTAGASTAQTAGVEIVDVVSAGAGPGLENQ